MWLAFFILFSYKTYRFYYIFFFLLLLYYHSVPVSVFFFSSLFSAYSTCLCRSAINFSTSWLAANLHSLLSVTARSSSTLLAHFLQLIPVYNRAAAFSYVSMSVLQWVTTCWQDNHLNSILAVCDYWHFYSLFPPFLFASTSTGLLDYFCAHFFMRLLFFFLSVDSSDHSHLIYLYSLGVVRFIDTIDSSVVIRHWLELSCQSCGGVVALKLLIFRGVRVRMTLGNFISSIVNIF